MGARDAETTHSHKAQVELGKKVNPERYDLLCVTFLNGLPIHARSTEEVSLFG